MRGGSHQIVAVCQSYSPSADRHQLPLRQRVRLLLPAAVPSGRVCQVGVVEDAARDVHVRADVPQELQRLPACAFVCFVVVVHGWCGMGWDRMAGGSEEPQRYDGARTFPPGRLAMSVANVTSVGNGPVAEVARAQHVLYSPGHKQRFECLRQPAGAVRNVEVGDQQHEHHPRARLLPSFPPPLAFCAPFEGGKKKTDEQIRTYLYSRRKALFQWDGKFSVILYLW